MRHGLDLSNFSEITPRWAEVAKFSQDFIIIGLQNSGIARYQRDLLSGGTAELMYYVDIPGRDITIPAPDSLIWIDIEENCFEAAQDVRDQGTANTSAGHRTGIYCTRWSIKPLFGDSSELADYGCPLWLAAYEAPDFASFVPFNGWSAPLIWQFAGSTPYLGVNVDLNVRL